MQIGILSDAHGNTEGLSLCLRFLERRRVEKIYFLGDACGYLPDGDIVLQLLESSQAVCLLGNHDAMRLGHLDIDNDKKEIYRIHTQNKKKSYERKSLSTSRLPFLSLCLKGRKILLVHGSPWNPLLGRINSDFNMERFSNFPFDAIFMGHTHRPFIKHSGQTAIVNVGSCGLPRDRGDLVSCVIYDIENGHCELFRIRQDVQKILNKHGTTIHHCVRECLLRQDTDEIIGTLVMGDFLCSSQ